MATTPEIYRLLDIARKARLDGLDFLDTLDIATIRDGYNGIGPQFLPEPVREKVTERLALFEPAALVHDLRNEYSDGTRSGFHYANDEFRANCRKCAAAEYRWWSWRRYFAYHVAAILYRFVEAEEFGWKAWLQAKERHAQKISGNNAGGNKGEK